jgi:L-lactate dehydrogenase complex protein LldG
MKEAGERWGKHFRGRRSGPELFAEFEMRARAASTEVFRVKTAAEAQKVMADLVRSTGAKKAVAVDSPLQRAAAIHETLRSLGVQVYTESAEIATHAADADLGLSSVEFGIAETGSVLQEAGAVESRLVSALPPLHIAFLESRNIVPGLQDAFDLIALTFDRGYISLITGPSRTADIERVLTIGVHGPSRFVLIAMDAETDAGEGS